MSQTLVFRKISTKSALVPYLSARCTGTGVILTPARFRSYYPFVGARTRSRPPAPRTDEHPMLGCRVTNLGKGLTVFSKPNGGTARATVNQARWWPRRYRTLEIQRSTFEIGDGAALRSRSAPAAPISLVASTHADLRCSRDRVPHAPGAHHEGLPEGQIGRLRLER